MQRLEKEAREAVLPEPSFGEYFDREAEGKYVFDNTSGVDRERASREEEFQRIEEDQESEHLYRRELLARLHGGKLTARQLGVLLKSSSDPDTQGALTKAAEFSTKANGRDAIRTSEELLESYRRRQVLTGKWSEGESHRLLQNELDALQERLPTSAALDIYIREGKKRV